MRSLLGFLFAVFAGALLAVIASADHLYLSPPEDPTLQGPFPSLARWRTVTSQDCFYEKRPLRDSLYHEQHRSQRRLVVMARAPCNICSIRAIPCDGGMLSVAVRRTTDRMAGLRSLRSIVPINVRQTRFEHQLLLEIRFFSRNSRNACPKALSGRAMVEFAFGSYSPIFDVARVR